MSPSVAWGEVQGGQVGDHSIQVNIFAPTRPSPRPPLAVGVVPPLAEAYQERVQAALLAEHVGRGASTVVLCGDGGTGKTQLAVAAFQRAAAEGVEVRLWVNAVSRSSVLGAYCQAATALRLPCTGEDVATRASTFLSWLTTASRSWLIVLDDLSDPVELKDLWPAGPTGRTIVTTRRRDHAVTGRAPTLHVDVFHPHESLAYLMEKLAPPIERRQAPHNTLVGAMELADDMGHLPVALAQAAAVIVDQAITCERYRELFADRSRQLTRLFPTDAAADGYQLTVDTTWSLALERADRLPPHGMASAAMALASVLDPHGSPLALWKTQAARTLMSARMGGVNAARNIPQAALASAGEDDARAAVRALHRLSLVTHVPDGGPRAVRTHALAQRATLEHLESQDLDATVVAAADALLQIWPVIARDTDLEESLRGNTQRLREVSDRALWAPQPHPTLVRLGKSLGDVGLVAAARDYFSKLAAQCTIALGPGHTITIYVARLAAQWRGKSGDVTGATTALEDIARTALTTLGASHPETLSARAQLARLRAKRGDYHGAITELLDVSEERHQLLGGDHPQTLSTRADLARWRGKAGDPSAAVRELQALLQDRTRLLGDDHPETLSTRAHLAKWHGRAGKPALAVIQLRGLLADRIRTLGPEHPHTLTTRGQLARWTAKTGNLKEVIAASESLLKDRLRLLGSDHPDTLTTRRDLARWRGKTGDYPGAVNDLRSLLADQTRVLGLDHPDSLTTRGNIAHFLARQGDEGAAIRVATALLTDRTRILGEDHPATCTTRRDLARWEGESGPTAPIQVRPRSAPKS